MSFYSVVHVINDLCLHFYPVQASNPIVKHNCLFINLGELQCEFFRCSFVCKFKINYGKSRHVYGEDFGAGVGSCTFIGKLHSFNAPFYFTILRKHQPVVICILNRPSDFQDVLSLCCIIHAWCNLLAVLRSNEIPCGIPDIVP